MPRPSTRSASADPAALIRHILHDAEFYRGSTGRELPTYGPKFRYISGHHYAQQGENKHWRRDASADLEKLVELLVKKHETGIVRINLGDHADVDALVSKLSMPTEVERTRFLDWLEGPTHRCISRARAESNGQAR